MRQDTGKIVRCPACGRTSKVPISILIFNCVFCGCRVDASRVWVIAIHHSQHGGAAGEVGPGQIDLVLRWPRRPRLWLSLLACGVIVLLGAAGLPGFPLARSDPSLALSLAPVGLLAGYVALAKMFNHSDLHVDPDVLKVSHRPLPWMGEVQLRIDEIAGFTVHQIKKGRFWQYELRAELKDDRQVSLLTGLEYQETARFLQDRLHAYLRSLG